jgi:hypothetical protein
LCVKVKSATERALIRGWVIRLRVKKIDPWREKINLKLTSFVSILGIYTNGKYLLIILRIKFKACPPRAGCLGMNFKAKLPFYASHGPSCLVFKDLAKYLKFASTLIQH